MKLTENQKYIGYAIGTGIGIFTAVKIYKAIKTPSAKAQDKAFDQAQVGTFNIIEIAQQLGQDLGVAYSWYDPRRATENDNDVKELLLSIPKQLIPFVRIEYAKLYNRNLQADLQKLLDSYSEIKYLFV